MLIVAKGTWDDDEEYDGLLEATEDAAVDEMPQPLHGLEGQAYACMDHNVVNDLAKIESPTLVIGGEDYIFVPHWIAREVANGISDSDIHLYPGAGHAFHWGRVLGPGRTWDCVSGYDARLLRANVGRRAARPSG